MNSNAKWKNSRKSIAKLKGNKLIAQKKGVTYLTKSVSGKKTKYKVVVEKPALSLKNITLQVGNTKKLKLKGTTQKVTWHSANKKIATVSKNGKITAISSGKVKITAKVNKKSYLCTVKVITKNTDTQNPQNSGKYIVRKIENNTLYLSLEGSKEISYLLNLSNNIKITQNGNVVDAKNIVIGSKLEISFDGYMTVSPAVIWGCTEIKIC